MSKKYALPPVGRGLFGKTLALFVLFLLTSSVKAQWSQMNGGNCNITYALCADATNTKIYAGMLPDPSCTGGGITNTPGANHVVVWNGSTWAQLNASCSVGGGVTGTIYAIAVSGTKVFVGGDFTKANGTAGYNGIACWDTGTNTWTAMGTGVGGSNATVYALTVDAANNILYVGGEFTTANGTTVNNVAAWNIGSSTWSAMGGSPGVTTAPGGMLAGMSVGVYALTYCNSKLYVGGRFVNAGGAAANNIAAWDGSSWSTLTGGGQIGVSNTTYVNPQNVASAAWDAPVMALTNDGTIVYVGGDFNKVNNATGCNNIAAWNTSSSTWSTLGNGMTWPSLGTTSTDNTFGDQANIYALTMYNGNLIAGGDFMKAGTVGGANTDLFVAQWNGSAWSGMTASCGGSINSDVFCLAVSNNTLYAGGQFIPGPAGLYYVGQYTGAGPTITMNVGSGTTICSSTTTTLSASGASTYTWSANAGGVHTSTVSVSPSGTTVYTVSGTSSGCSSSKTVTVTVVATPTLTVSGPANLCNGSSTTFTAATATNYSWSTGATTNTISVTPGLGTTTYTVTGDNGSGCVASKTVSVVVSAQPTLSISGASSTCSGTPVVLTGGTTAGTYTWSANAGGASTNTVSVSPSSNTTYTLSGSNGACSASATITITVTPTPTLSVNNASICSGQNVVLTASTNASTYTWSANAGSATTSTVSVNPASTDVYTVTADNGGGCTVTNTATVTVNTTPTVSISGAAPICSGQSLVLTGGTATNYTWLPGGLNTSTISVSPPSGSTSYTLVGANGTCTATATALVDVSPTPTITATGTVICSGQSVVISAAGAPNYTWSANAGSVNTSTASVNPSGTTSYTVTGAQGSCTNTAVATVTVNTTPTLTLTSNTYTICNGNSTAISASGASSYTWTTGGGLSCTVCPSPNANPTSTTVYTVTGTSTGCNSAPATVTVSVNPLPTLTLSASSNSICSSTSSTLTASGASSYTWSPAGSLDTPNGSTVTATPSGNTTYTVTGTDANGCVNSDNISITVAPTPTINITPTPAAVCSGSGIVLTGGTADTYTWSSNAGGVNTNTVSVNPTSNTTYTLNGTVGSCTASAVTTVSVNPNPVIGTASVSPAPCGQSTGCINSVPVSGGTPSYQYSWDNGTTWSASSQYCNLSAGIYTVEVSDQNNCMATATVTVSSLNGPNPPVAAVSSTVACLGDTANLGINSPQPGVTYTWTDITGNHTGTTYTITNLNPGGSYTVGVTATDSNNCSASSSVTIFVHDLPNTTVSGNTHFCQGLNTVLHALPSGSGYTYQWTQGGTPISGATLSNYTATAAGNYGVVITDNNTGCKASSVGNYTVMVDSVPLIDTTNMNIVSSGCNMSTGSITNVTVTPANGNTYSWTDAGGNVVGTGINLGNVPAGNYCLHVSTMNNCKDSICSLAINNSGAPNAPVLATPNNTYCQGQTINPVTVTGTPTITWYSDPGLTTQLDTGATYTPAAVATTTLYVTSTSNGCQGAATQVVITINPNPSLPIVSTPGYTYCQSQAIGTIMANGASTILWSTSPNMNPVINTGNTYTPSGLPVGTTIFYLTDSSGAGCKSVGTTTVSVTINQTPSDPVAMQQSYNYCQGQTINPIGVNGSGNVIWSTSPTMSPVIYVGLPYTPQPILGTTTYYVQDSTNAGCKSIGTATISVTVNPTPNPPTPTVPNYTYCQGQTVGAITVNGTGNVLWSTNSSMNPIINIGNTYTPGGLPFGTTTYYLEDSTNAGCKSLGTSTVSVTIYPSPTVSGGSADTAKCGAPNGGVNGINVTGGTPGYHYQWYNGSSPMAGDTLPTLSGVGGGTYSVVVTDVNGCLASGGTVVFNVTSTTPVTASITPHMSQGIAPLSVTFANSGSGATNYNWSFGDGTFSTQQNPPAITYTAAGTYTVLLYADNGSCAAADTAYIVVDAPVNIQVPNVYSPNGDGINDEWYIICSGIRDLHCDIFNRWGQLVYQLFGVDQKWDGIMINGNHATEGTYYYIMDAVGYDGKEYKSHGPITLVK